MRISKRSPLWNVLIVLLPVVAGSLLATITTITSNYYSQKMQGEEARRKEEAASREAQMIEQKKQIEVLASIATKFMNDLQLQSFPTSKEAMLHLEVHISVHHPALQEDVAQVRKVYDEFLERLKHAHDLGDDEVLNNLEKEVAPVMASVRALLAKASRQVSATGP
jgi:neutral trehalase